MENFWNAKVNFGSPNKNTKRFHSEFGLNSRYCEPKPSVEINEQFLKYADAKKLAYLILNTDNAKIRYRAWYHLPLEDAEKILADNPNIFTEARKYLLQEGGKSGGAIGGKAKVRKGFAISGKSGRKPIANPTAAQLKRRERYLKLKKA